MSFQFICGDIDVSSTKDYLVNNPQEFGIYPHRTSGDSVHRESQDIWVRYGDIETAEKSGDYSIFQKEHDSIWYPISERIPQAKELCKKVMEITGLKTLGGVLITKLPPSGKIHPHTDGGWHAACHRKFMLSIQNEKGAIFGFNSGNIEPNSGELWEFDNSVPHWVDNNSSSDRIAMIICLR